MPAGVWVWMTSFGIVPRPVNGAVNDKADAAGVIIEIRLGDSH